MRKIFDVIIVGSGIAGLSAGIMLKKSGLNVVVITKNDKIEETNTNYAQGGIIAWKKGDTKEQLAKDLLSAGCYYNNTAAVKAFADEAPHLVQDFLINEIGIPFSTTDEGELHYTGEAAHSQRRVLHYADHTGDIIQQSLIDYAKKIELPIYHSHTAVDLITNNHHSNDCQEFYKQREVMGVYVLDNQKEEMETFFAHKVILASGGIGHFYQYTTNPPSATGDGISMAYRAGADIINSEFVQFHPTCLFHKDIKRFLISEAVRGEGGKLFNHAGKAFMKDYSQMEDLAPRDVVSRAIYEEMSKEGQEYMLLDIGHFYNGSKPIKERFSKIYATCLRGGIDITKDPIPIVPAAHYNVGGVKADLMGRTSLRNLYAIGEVSCTGLHGANRLASSSLLEGLYWGKKTSDDIANNFDKIDQNRFDNIPDWAIPKYTEEFDPLLIKQDWKAIQLTMWNYAGIVRTQKGLERAFSDLNYYAHRIFKFYRRAKLNRDIIELRNAVVGARIIVNAASHNKNSIGCHFVSS